MFNNIKYNVMKIINYSFKNKPSILLVIIGVILTSCGSYQYVGQTNDGIYETSESEVIITDNESNDNYYTNYFRDKALEVENLNTEESDIFTDIDTYQSTYTDSTNVKQNAGWGETNNQVVVNLYNDVYTDQLYRYGWGNWTDVYFYNYGWNNWRWNRPYGFYNGWGWNNWGWNYGVGFYDPFWCPPYYGGIYAGNFYNPYYGYNNYGYYGNNRYYNRNVAYNSGRRGSITSSNVNRSTSRRSNVINSSNSSNTRFNSPRRTSNSSINSTNSNTRTRSNNTRVRSNNNSVSPSNSGTRSNNTRVSTPRRSSSNSSSVRSSSSTRSSSPSVRSSSGSSRSSSGGSSRSSGGSSRRGNN